MGELMQSMLDSWGDVHARHALLVHFPIALSYVGLALAIALAFVKFGSASLRWASVACLAVAAGGAYLAEQAGEASHDDIHDTVALTDAEHEAVEAHQALGEGGWKWPAIPAIFIALTALRNRKAKVIVGSLGIAAAVGVGGWVSVTGLRGGQIVYVYGLGTPERTAAAGAPAPHEHEEAGEHTHEDEGEGTPPPPSESGG